MSPALDKEEREGGREDGERAKVAVFNHAHSTMARVLSRNFVLGRKIFKVTVGGGGSSLVPGFSRPLLKKSVLTTVLASYPCHWECAPGINLFAHVRNFLEPRPLVPDSSPRLRDKIWARKAWVAGQS